MSKKDNEHLSDNGVRKKDGNTAQENRRMRWAIGILLLIILIMLLRCCGFGETTIPIATDPVHNPDDSAPTLDPNAGEYVEPEKQEVSRGVAIPGWGEIEIPANQKDDITVDFYNPDANANLYYLTFEIRILDDSDQGYEVLYKSGLIEPGLHIQKISLTRALDAGEYDAIIHVQPYRISDKTMTNNADMKTKLIVH